MFLATFQHEHNAFKVLAKKEVVLSPSSWQQQQQQQRRERAWCRKVQSKISKIRMGKCKRRNATSSSLNDGVLAGTIQVQSEVVPLLINCQTGRITNTSLPKTFAAREAKGPEFADCILL